MFLFVASIAFVIGLNYLSVTNCNELSVTFDPRDSTCKAQCSSCSSVSASTGPNNAVTSADQQNTANCDKSSINQTSGSITSLIKLQGNVASISNNVMHLKRAVNTTLTASLADITDRLEDLVSICNASMGGSKPDVQHISIGGARWTRFWWYNDTAGVGGWPKGETDVLGSPYGTCSEDSYYCFGRLPHTLKESKSELLAIDSAGTIYRWKFAPKNPVAHAVWDAFYNHLDQSIINSQAWNPKVIRGLAPVKPQDSFMYRRESGVKSVLLDDDNCDCLSTLSMGHGMCGKSGFNPIYAKADWFGVDLLYNIGCNAYSGPNPEYGLTLYFKDDN